jgi:hypothetical protein
MRDFDFVAKIGLTLLAFCGVIGCRSTTPMAGVSSAQNTNSKVNTGLGLSLGESAVVNSPNTATAPVEKKNNIRCIFGSSLDELANSPNFEMEKRGTVEREAASQNLEGKTLLFAYTEYLHKVTNTKYSVFNTFLKSVDGGVTKGWIQTTKSEEVVAQVEDGEIQNCSVVGAHNHGMPVSYQDETCLFGFEVGQLLESPRFKVVEDKEVFKIARMMHEGKKRQRFRFVKVSDTKMVGTEYGIYLKNSDIQGSNNFDGWIESTKQSELLALIGESEIYECIIDGQGHVVGKITELSDGCLFGKDFHDLELSPDFVLSSQAAEVSLTPRVRRASRPKQYKRKALLHKATGQSYIVFHTFRDADDDGKTQGWIETIDGRLVAEIFETGIRNCHI